MKTCLLIFLMIFSSLQNITQAQGNTKGIKFFKGNWKSLIKEAARQRKLIFVDVYTDWCLPCKRMEKEIFTLKEAGQVYNQSFISYRLNAEQGEVKKLAQHYAVKAYPTYLFLDTEGNLVHRSGDYLKAPEFIAAGVQALKQFKMQDLARLEARFKAGERQRDFLEQLVRKRSQMGLDNTQALNAYVLQIPQDQLSTTGTLHFLSEHIGSSPSDALPLILKHLSEIPKNDQQAVAQKIYDKLLYYALGKAINEKRMDEAMGYLANIETLRPLLTEKQLPSADNLALHYYHTAKDTSGLKKVGFRIAKKQLSVPMDSIRARDLSLYKQAMQPFISGKEDSTTIPGFQEEKKLAAIQYSAHIATNLYTVSDFFKQDLDAHDPSLLDAINWMKFATAIYKKESIVRLCTELELIVAGK